MHWAHSAARRGDARPRKDDLGTLGALELLDGDQIGQSLKGVRGSTFQAHDRHIGVLDEGIENPFGIVELPGPSSPGRNVSPGCRNTAPSREPPRGCVRLSSLPSLRRPRIPAPTRRIPTFITMTLAPRFCAAAGWKAACARGLKKIRPMVMFSPRYFSA